MDKPELPFLIEIYLSLVRVYDIPRFPDPLNRLIVFLELE